MAPIERVCSVFGSGASVSAGVATVSLVIKEIAQILRLSIGMGQTLPNIAMAVEEFSGGRDLLTEVLYRGFSTKNAPAIIHKLIVMQRPRLIITTNYDNLL